MTASGWRFEWRRTWDEVWDTTFVREWSTLFDRDSHALPYHHPGLVRAWSETVGAALQSKPMVGVAHDTSGSTVLLPWVLEPGHGRLITRRRLLPAGAGVFGYGRPLVVASAPIDWSSFWPALTRDVAREADLIEVAFLEPALAQGAPAVPAGDPCPIINVASADSLEAVLARCSPNHRTDIRRRFRRLEETGDTRFALVANETRDGAVDMLCTQLLPAYEEQWPVSGGRGLLVWPQMREFLERIIVDGVRDGWGQFAILSLNGKAIAWHIGFIGARDWYWWMPAYDAAAAQWSPGKVLLARWVEMAVAQGVERLHLQAGAQPYKMAWRPDIPDLVSLRVYGSSMRGKLLQAYDGPVAS